jgi:hypothetical protein
MRIRRGTLVVIGIAALGGCTADENTPAPIAPSIEPATSTSTSTAAKPVSSDTFVEFESGQVRPWPSGGWWSRDHIAASSAFFW